jgi:hypothetical protein
MWKGYGIEHATWEPLQNIPAVWVRRFRAGELPDPDVFDDVYGTRARDPP